MSNWEFLNKHRVKEPSRLVDPKYCTTDADGFNGMFRIPINGGTIRCIVSDGMGWQHVSVSIEFDKRPPRWEAMCFIKDLFWEDEDCVVQFHPPKSQYVNHHAGCLHLWRYTGGGPFEQPTPHHILVGPKSGMKPT